ncbi:serine/threonine kinase with two-component sensor domain [Richelia sinica FACHB-800]|uniref:histidine kinase n=1 Tax=Richelia sinica FACHB-800 TaxID=1357546 RepID=A0A975Y3G7_9NOST|nr:AAA family ATPase [Richelia sinica]MBD2664478.1 AAA family ATPase [Richelia sinica FACHB-800]QXE22110.1 serine/threonine kinase with two-component sensor domain [Richelia sinica FACHB-800]
MAKDENKLAQYRITETIHVGTRTLVYRGIRMTDNFPVVLKLMRKEFPTFNELVQFRNQYTISKNINIPGVVQSLGLEPYQNGYILVMADDGGIALNEYVKRYPHHRLPIGDFLDIAIQINDILAEIHRQCIIHKDIKPANIVINPITKQVKIIDFSIASLLPKENQKLKAVNILEGTLAYLSPEQTGRMNRSIDYRTDFYSLGVTFYQLLTGKIPFDFEDPMELVHYHLAKKATPPDIINPNIPPIISQIIGKLMAKNAEERYQSALGLKFDLETCRQSLIATGTIPKFVIGSKDIQERFIIPEKLYGREKEVKFLLDAFDRVSLVQTEMVLVAGFSGIGKTAVINEIHKPVVEKRGYFIKGKFDQFNRNIPFSALVAALRDLMGQLLSENDQQLHEWQEKIIAALGENAQVIIDVVPELEGIIGKQPAVPELSGSASQNRFYLLFQKFLQVFATKDHPLVIFLDDLQWSDLASLQLIKLLITEKSNCYLLLIGAYRDNEVSPTHPLMLMVDEIRLSNSHLKTITLAPLSESKLNNLISDTLGCSQNSSLPLTKLVYQKTQGNPFFARQFLKSLYQDGLIKFDCQASCWQCDITQINQSTLTDDVVVFMTIQLQKLSASTQRALQLAACIGNTFDLKTLAIVSQQSEIETAACLWQGLQEGLIVPNNEIYKIYVGNDHQSLGEDVGKTVSYKFFHDRVQQAAYALIADSQKQITHFQIGQLLLQQIAPNHQEERIFEIVNQLNCGQELLTKTEEKLQLAQLNLSAGLKAKLSTAYVDAIAYLTTGIQLLPPDCWQNQAQLTLALHEAAAEAAYLNGHFDQMETYVKEILDNTTTLEDQITAYEVKLQGLKAQNRLQAAIAFGLDVLQHLGVDVPKQPTQADIEAVMSTVLQGLPTGRIEDLIDLPVMTDPLKLAAARIFVSLSPTAHLALPELLPIIAAKQVELAWQYGNAPAHAHGYATCGMILCGVFGEIESGYEYGQLALKLIEKLKIKTFRAPGILVATCFTQHWKQHVRTCLPQLFDAYTAALNTGDLEHASFSLQYYSHLAYFSGLVDLSTLAGQMQTYGDFISSVKQESVLQIHQINLQAVMNLLGEIQHHDYLVGQVYDEQKMLPLHLASNHRGALYYLHLHKSFLAYLFADYSVAVDASLEAENYLDAGVGSLMTPVFYTYDSLALLSIYSQVDSGKRTQILEKVAANQSLLKNWADYAPMNYLHKFYLVAAEQYRVLDEKANALELYDQAIATAKENSYIQEEAIANELAAKFYLDWGKEKVAQAYMVEAYYCYSRWGATAKVKDLEKRYPKLLSTILHPEKLHFIPTENSEHIGTISTVGTLSNHHISHSIDVAAIIKISQTLSSNIELDKLLWELMQILMENTGAKKAALILPQDNSWVIAAYTTLDQEASILQSIPVYTSEDIAIAPINYVKHTRETIIIDDNLHLTTFASDPYLLRVQPKSLLVTPIFNQGKLIGVLYLENQLTAGVFTKERLEVIQFLCSQVAISLDNARLYARAQEKSQQLEQFLGLLAQQEAQYRSIFEAVADGLSIIDLETGQFVAANPACCQMYGYKIEEWLELAPADFIHQEYLSSFERFITAVKADQEFNEEVICIHKDGRLFPVAVKAKAFIYNGKPHALSILRDVSKQKKAEAEIIQKSSALEAALQEIKNVQIHLIQSEKMSALGNLVAGVAHEINNPVGFIAGNIQPAYEGVQDLFTLLDLYQQTFPEPGIEIEEEIANIDLEYLRQDIPKLIASMQEGVKRIHSISNSLRTFSRADTEYKVPFNIHDGLDSTILILKHRLKANDTRPAIEVITNYADIPQIQCFPGQLNQVFMNLLANAIDAIEESNLGRNFLEIQSAPNLIHIATNWSLDRQYIDIHIQDNGAGIPPEVKNKIFEHLFTTKAVNKGTGLGLAIARQIIVEKHGGGITVNSTPGKGTEFIISIPIA